MHKICWYAKSIWPAAGMVCSDFPVTWWSVTPERAFWKGSELVEEWGNDHRVDSHHEKGSNQDEEPKVQCNQGPCVLQDQGD